MEKNKSRTDKFLLNVTTSALLQLVTIITGMITPRLMLEYYGSDVNGLTTSINQFINYIVLVEAGLSNAAVYALYRPLASGDTESRDAIVSATRLSYRNIGFVFLGLAVSLAGVYPLLMHDKVMSYGQTFMLVIVLCMNSVLNFFVMAKYRVLLTADQSAYYISFSSSIQLLLNMVIIVLMLKLALPGSDNVVIVRGVAIISILACAAILSFIVRKKYGRINFYAKPDMKALDKRNAALVMQVLGIIQNSAPVVIMTSLIDMSMVSVYSIYNMAAGTVTTCIGVFTSGLAANFGNIKASGDNELLRKTHEQYRVCVFTLCTVFYSVMMITIIPFVRIYTDGITDVNYIIPALGVLITFKGLMEVMRSPYGMLIYSLGKYKEVNPWTVIQTVLTVVLGVIFTKLWGLIGIMYAVSISGLFMLVVMVFFTKKYLLDISRRNEAFRLIRIVLIVIITYYISGFFSYQPGNWLEWFIYAIIVGIVVSAVTFLINLPFEKKIYIAVYDRLKVYLKSKLKRKQA